MPKRLSELRRNAAQDLVLVDLRMPGKSGIDVVQELRAIDSSMTIMVLTGYGSIPTAIAAMKKGADHYLSKPADADEILAAYETLGSGPGDPPDTPQSVPSLARVKWEEYAAGPVRAATATSRSPPVCWAFTAGRCNASFPNIHPPDERTSFKVRRFPRGDFASVGPSLLCRV